MLNWLKKVWNKPARYPHAAIGTLIDAAYNTAGTMTWANLFGILKSEQMYAGNADATLKLAAVKCALDIYTGMVQSLPRRMYQLESGTQKKIRVVTTTDHPSSRIFSHYFHPELNSDDALLTIVYDMLMDGNCYFVREFDTMGRTSRLYYIHPTRIPRGNIYRANGSEDLATGRKAVRGEILYQINTGLSQRDQKVESILLPRSEIAHFKARIPDTEYHRAQGFVLNADSTLKLYRASEEFGTRFFTRGIAQQTYLTTDNRLAPEVLKRIEANFIDDPDAPLDSIFKTRILEQGLKPVNTGIPLQHLQFIETRAFSVEDVGRGLGVPPTLLHSYMGTTKGNVDVDAAIAQFIQTGIGPLLSRICSQFRTELLPLPSQMLYSFEFETLYLYRNVIDKFSTSLRNLFEIGMLDRIEGRDLLGLHIDPSDPAANPRYVPVNLMTVDHSLHLEKGAELQNGMLTAQTEAQQKSNDGMVSQEEYEAAEEKAAQAEAKPPSGKMDKSPSGSNIDKRIRNAFLNVINGLKQYETRVLDQKKQSRPDDYEQAVAEFYNTGSKFHALLSDQLFAWKDMVTVNGASLDNLLQSWLTSQKCPEGIENEIACIES